VTSGNESAGDAPPLSVQTAAIATHRKPRNPIRVAIVRHIRRWSKRLRSVGRTERVRRCVAEFAEACHVDRGGQKMTPASRATTQKRKLAHKTAAPVPTIRTIRASTARCTAGTGLTSLLPHGSERGSGSNAVLAISLVTTRSPSSRLLKEAMIGPTDIGCVWSGAHSEGKWKSPGRRAR
jgi:hypothetical protein